MKKFTQMDFVIDVLQIKGSATTDELIGLGVRSPSAVIHGLRSSGYCIKTRYVARKCKKNPFSHRQAEYKLFAPKPPLFVKLNQEDSK
jgi:hypothetical protein